MKVNITARNLELSTSERTMVNNIIQDKFDRFFEENDDTVLNVTITKKPRIFHMTIKVTYYNTSIRGEAEEPKFNTALNKAIDDTKRKIRKTKTKTINKKRTNDTNISASVGIDLPMSEYSSSQISKNKTIKVETLSDEDAMFKADMLGYAFFVYKSETDNSNAVIFKRKDGTFGKLNIV
jgi:putative sigma-54 modulation protein